MASHTNLDDYGQVLDTLPSERRGMAVHVYCFMFIVFEGREV